MATLRSLEISLLRVDGHHNIARETHIAPSDSFKPREQFCRVPDSQVGERPAWSTKVLLSRGLIYSQLVDVDDEHLFRCIECETFLAYSDFS
jgi:hypothetical protein